ncbi:MAG: UDP-N-acetylmuramoyl-tripeptide--D-alanyl-D-alanine ligase [Candidatus Omnitrophica bacterium]|nr:UDP-N-acetylmuramoyl-tripeptide--D-alanyl-D-alanine ligase [Candidatus Omnitrophota bacterium]MDD5236687.1 UDP-N-acetylmuramoyl-tripeptide--D-alanyl-D-alanine ligase [Candidatus Omnitrophota bacterium]MDD5610025.1 UDP-N-acetylmuramoyl-tripeptide--D-alanyl-D-alanine ligase [Candidatus Omnitrophota bacterium]
MLTVPDILKATGGKLLQGRTDSLMIGVSIDSRTLKQGDLFIALKGKNFNGHNFVRHALQKRAAGIISQADITTTNAYAHIPVIKVKDSTKALGDIARYHRSRFDLPVVAVTGSNGKTTTKDMLAWILGGSFSVLKNTGTKNNAIGVPLTLLGLGPRHDICVLEMGTNHFGEIAHLTKIANPNIGLITNIGPSHLEFFKDKKGVLKEKSDLIKGLASPAISLINADDEFLGKARQLYGSRPLFKFGLKNITEFRASSIRCRAAEKIEFLVNREHKFVLRTCGLHNVYNALAAIGVARLFGLEYRDMAKRLNNFSFPEGRLKFIRMDKINFIDDTYNSNPLSLDWALSALKNMEIKGRKIFIMGDMLELGAGASALHRQAAEKIGPVCDYFISVGKLARLSAEVLREKKRAADRVFSCSSPGEARDVLLNKIIPGRHDIVLVKGSRGLTMEKVFR